MVSDQRTRYKDQLHVNVKACELGLGDRIGRHESVEDRKRCSSGMKQFEEQRLEYVTSRRACTAEGKCLCQDCFRWW